MKYPTDIVTDDGWARIHRGHALDQADLLADLHQGMGDPGQSEVLTATEVHLQYRPRVKWCDPACDNEGEWHAHWEAVRPHPDAAFTLVRWAAPEPRSTATATQEA